MCVCVCVCVCVCLACVQVNRQLAGPKPFPLDRLMAIFYSIFDKSVGVTCGLYSQVSEWVGVHSVCVCMCVCIPTYTCVLHVEGELPVCKGRCGYHCS